MRQVARQAQSMNYNVRLLTCVDEAQLSEPLPENTLNTNPVYSNVLPGYESISLNFPSFLLLMQQIVNEQPDRIVISTPGPLGILSLVCAKLLEIPVYGVYHTDFAEQVLRMTDDNKLAETVDQATNLFFKQLDHVYVPSQSYISLLSQRGLKRDSMSIFPRGIDASVYRPIEIPSAATKSDPSEPQTLNEPITLLFAGRISHDKNLKLLISISETLHKQEPGRYRMVIAGDGPALESLKKEAGDNVEFTGRISASELVVWYNTADLFVFPSHTDTFGMVVLEAQACGLPCLVTNTGGPKEIILDGETGAVLSNDDPIAWCQAVRSYVEMKESEPERFDKVKQDSVRLVQENNSWAAIFDYLFGNDFLSIRPNKSPDKENQSYPLDKIA